MNEDRLTRRAMLAILVTGLITAGIALAATIFVIGTVQPSYTAKSQVALTPNAQLTPEDKASYWEALGGGQAGRIAAEVFQQDQWKTAAAAAAGVNPSSIIVTAGVVESTALINVTVETTSPQGAEAALAKIITDATPVVLKVSGPYDLQVVQPAAGTAVSSSISSSQLLIVVFIGGLLVGSGAALIVTRARSRNQDEPEFYDTGEFRAAQGSGYNRPVGPPPGRGPQGGPPPNGNNGNGAYGPPPRRPVGDPRAQPPR